MEEQRLELQPSEGVWDRDVAVEGVWLLTKSRGGVLKSWKLFKVSMTELDRDSSNLELEFSLDNTTMEI